MFLLLGSSGMLASNLYNYFTKKSIKVIRQSRSNDFDIQSSLASFKEVEILLNQVKPDFVINTIALTDVDLCEKYKDKAKFINTIIPKYISQKCYEFDIPFLHISTDHVYDDLFQSKEGDVKIKNTYAESKYLGDLEIVKRNATSLRTNFVGKSNSAKRFSFSDWIINNAYQKKNTILFEDIYFSALHTSHLAEIILKISHKPVAGIFNVGTKDSISKKDFALHLLKILKISNRNFTIGKSSDINLFAERPKNMSMSVEKVENTFKLIMPKMSEVLRLSSEDYYHEK